MDPQKTLELRDWFEKVEALPWDATAEPSRYYQSGDKANLFSAWVYWTSSPRLRVTMGHYLTDEADPAFEHQGKLDFVRLDDETKKWIALTYMVVFPDGTVGIIAGRSGPTSANIASYFQEKTDLGRIDLAQITYTDIDARLHRMKFVSRVNLAVHPGSLLFPSLVDVEGDVELALQAGSQMRDAKIFRFTIEAEKKQPIEGAIETVRRLFRRLPSEPLSLETFEVSGPDKFNNRDIPVDMLGEYLCVTKRVELRKKELVPESAHRAIEEAYAENAPELKRRPSVSIHPEEDSL